MCDSPELLHALERLTKAVEGQYKRGYEDTTYQVSDTQGFVLDYRGYRYLFVYSETALTFKLGGSSYPIAANQWTLLAFKEGFKIFTSGQATPVGIRVRAIDDLMALAGAITQGTSPWIVSVSNGNPNGQTTMVNSSPVTLASDQTPLTTNVGTQTSVASSGSDGTILAANSSRKGAVIFNDSTQTLFLLLASGVSSATNYSVQIPSNGYFELPPQPIYTGIIKGLWAAANGNARVTEFS